MLTITSFLVSWLTTSVLFCCWTPYQVLGQSTPSPVGLQLYQNNYVDNWLSTVTPSDSSYSLWGTLGSCYGVPVTGTSALYEYTFSVTVAGGPRLYHYYTTYWLEQQPASGCGATLHYVGIPCWVYRNDTPATGTKFIYQYIDPGFCSTYYSATQQSSPLQLQKIAWYMF